jgi:hypothetical protein
MKKVKTFGEWIDPIQFVMCSNCFESINLMESATWKKDEESRVICISCHRESNLNSLLDKNL